MNVTNRRAGAEFGRSRRRREGLLLLMLVATIAGCGSPAAGSGTDSVLPGGSFEMQTPGPTRAASASPAVTAGRPSAAPSKTFTQTRPFLAQHQNPRAILLADGRVLVVDGLVDTLYFPGAATAELYDPTSDAFASTGSPLPGGVAETVTLLRNGRVLLTGADEASAAEIYDPTTGVFSLTGSMVGGSRAGPAGEYDKPYTATLLRDGRVLIVGGERDGKYLASAELFDPSTGDFAATGSMAVGRENHSATLLEDGRVLIAGGDRGNTRLDQVYVATSELYDPSTGRFSPAGTMVTPRIRGTATLLRDGRVLLAGGSSDLGSGLKIAELYDPTTRKFWTAGSMIAGRSDAVACLLEDGKVLVVGGFGDDNPPSEVAAAELYDPVEGRFSPAGVVGDGVAYGSAVRLVDGRVLLVGPGLEYGELYWP